jgi:hypothetical protein
MSSARVLKNPAVLCTLLLALCTLATFPFLEMGGNDDFAYVRSAKALAETGHIVYFGWSSAMLGWQLVLGAFFIKLFGFSFTIARFSILLIALITTFLLQRVFVRLGLREANATFATLTIVLSPLFIPLSFSFMSDIPGLFAIVLSLYLCLRAIEDPQASRATGWLMGAAISSALLGTARQTGWLGCLVIVPSAFLIVRRRRISAPPLFAAWLLSLIFILASLHWFNHQMYATVETSENAGDDVVSIFAAATRVILETSFFLLPILIAFLPDLTRSRRRFLVSIAGVALFLAVLIFRPSSYTLGVLLAPPDVVGDYVTSVGILDLPAIGSRPVVLYPAARALLSIVTCLSAAAFFIALLRDRRTVPITPEETISERSKLSWRKVLLLLGPFTVSYCAFLGLRVFSGLIFDRYLLPLFVVFALLITRFYQERVSPRFPGISFIVLFLFAAYGVAGTHDMFAAERARLAAIQQLTKAGLPRSTFYGGFGYDGWTQIDQQGYIDVDDIRTPSGIHHVSPSQQSFKPCGYWVAHFFPAIRPVYAISYDNTTCDPQNRFPPVAYHLWLPPFTGAMYTRAVNPERLTRLSPQPSDSTQ